MSLFFYKIEIIKRIPFCLLALFLPSCVSLQLSCGDRNDNYMLYDYKCLQTFLVPPKGFYSQMLTPTFQKVTIIESLRAIASTYI